MDVPEQIPARIVDALSDPTAVMNRPHLVDELDEAVLAELGRIALSAIALEDVAYAVCRSVKPRHGPFDDFPIGARIDEALADLERECPEGPVRARAEAWLGEAKAALGQRNAVLHSVPVEVVGGAAAVAPMLDHFPKDRRMPMVRTPLTLDALMPITRRLKDGREGWVEVAVAEYPSSPLHGGTSAKPPKEWR